MTIARSATVPFGPTTLGRWINQGLESIWLLTVILVPLAFLSHGYAISEAEIAYVEVPKIALLRTLAALMAVLWATEWAIQGKPALASGNDRLLSKLHPSAWLPRLAAWLRDGHTRWLFLAVWFYLATTLVSTVLSGSFNISMWGEIPGQDGYAAYTVIAYIVVFGTVATHLKTRVQLWRLLGAIVTMGVLVAGYVVFQHYGHDFLRLSEETGGRITAFMGNRIFAAAVLSMAIPVSLMVSTVTIRDLVWTRQAPGVKEGKWPKALALMAASGLMISVQLLGIIFTLSRGSWVGAITAVALILGLGFLLLGWRAFARVVLTLGVAAGFILVFLQTQRSISLLGQDQWFGAAIALGASVGLVVVLANWRNLGRAVLAVGLAAMVAAAILILPSWLKGGAGDAESESQQSTVVDQPELSQVTERFVSIKSDVLGGFTGGRGTHWKVSWRLIRDRPWFEFDSLSLPWLRPLIGYGPDLFRFTYLLKSPAEGAGLVPLEPDHAHNYFIHQTVEQGYLGFLSSLGIFAAVFLTGGNQLLRRGKDLSHVHKLVLIGLLATLAGRFLEMMVGVARVSDLTILWVLLAVFAALPATMQSPQMTEVQTTRTMPSQASGRRHRRQSVNSQWGSIYNRRNLWRLALVAWLIGGIGMLTWLKSANYVRAAVVVGGEGIDHFRVGEFQATLTALDHAIELAPDVPSYYNYRAQTYFAFQMYQEATPEQECSITNDVPYQVCLGIQALQSNLAGVKQSPFYYRSRWALANSAYNLTLNDDAVTFYRQALALLPSSWLLREELAAAYIDAGNPKSALQFLEESLAITGDKRLSSRNLFLQGIAYRDLGASEESVRLLENSLAAGLSGTNAQKIHQMLTDLYAGLSWDRGIEVYDRAIQRNPTAAGSYYNRGLAYFDRGQYRQAILDFDRAINLVSDNWQYFNSRAQANLILLEKSPLSDFNAAIRLNPTNSELYVSRARVNHLQEGKPDEAIRDLDQAILLDPQNIEAYAYSAIVSIALGKPERAVQNLNRTIILGAQNKQTYLDRAQAYQELGQYDQAIRDFGAVIRLDPGDGSAYYQRGRLYEKLGQVNEAIDNYYLAHLNRGLVDVEPEIRDQIVEYSAQAIRENPQDGTAYALRGRIYGDSGQHNQAIDDLSRAIRLNARDDDAYVGRARAYLGIGLTRQANQDLIEANRLDSENVDALAMLGVLLSDMGQLDRAFPNLDKAVRLDPRNGRLYRLRGNIYRERSEFELAIQDYSTALSLDPKDSSTFNDRGIAYSRLEDFDRAIADFDSAIRLDPQRAEAFNNRGLAFERLGDSQRAIKDQYLARILRADAFGEMGQFDLALQQLDDAVRLDPQNGSGYYQRGRVYEKLGQVNEAIDNYYLSHIHGGFADIVPARKDQIVEYLTQAIRENPLTGATHALRGRMYGDLGQHNQAIDDLDQAIRLDAKDGQSYHARALAYLGIGLTRQANQDLIEANRLDSENVDALAMLGVLLSDMGQHDRAFPNLDKAIRLEPRNGRLYGVRGNAYRKRGDLERAIEDYNTALLLDPQDGLAFNDRGIAYSRLNDFDRAFEDFDSAIRLGPQHPETFKNRSLMLERLGLFERAANDQYMVHILQAAAYTELGQFEPALQQLDEAISLNPLDGKAYFDRGEVYRQMGDLQLALNDLDEALRIGPQDRLPTQRRGQIYYELGQYERALQDFVGAIDLGRLSELPGLTYALPYFEAGQAYFKLGRYQRAITDLDTAINLDPQLIQAHILKGKALVELDMLGAAIDTYSLAIAANTEAPHVYFLRGLADRMRGGAGSGFQDFDRAIRMGLRDSLAYTYRAEFYMGMTQYAEMVQDLNEAIRLDPQNRQAYLYRGISYSELGKTKAALQDMDQAIGLGVRDARAYTYRGFSYVQLGESEQAIRDFDEAITIGTQDRRVYHSRGQIYYGLGEYERALRDFVRAIDLGGPSELPELTYALPYFDAAQAYYKLGRHQRAIQDLDTALKLGSHLADAYVLRGKVRIELGQFQEAVADLSEAIHLNPDLYEAYDLRGRSYLELGQDPLAAQDFEKAKLLKDG